MTSPNERPNPRDFRKRLLNRKLLLGTFVKTPTSHNTEILGSIGMTSSCWTRSIRPGHGNRSKSVFWAHGPSVSTNLASDEARRMIDLGATVLMVGNDQWFMRSAAAAQLEQFKKLKAGAP